MVNSTDMDIHRHEVIILAAAKTDGFRTSLFREPERLIPTRDRYIHSMIPTSAALSACGDHSEVCALSMRMAS